MLFPVLQRIETVFLGHNQHFTSNLPKLRRSKPVQFNPIRGQMSILAQL